MKIKEFPSLKKKLEEEPPLVALLLSPEKEHAKQAFSFYKQEGMTLEKESFSSHRFMQEVETLPLFERKRLVHVEKIDTLDPSSVKTILNYLKSPSPTTLLLLSGEKLPSHSKLIKEVEARGIFFDFTEEKPWEREKRLLLQLIDYASQRGVTLSQEVARCLLDRSSKEESSIFQELEKVLCYIAPRTQINREDLEAISHKSHKETLWQLGEAIMGRDSLACHFIAKNLLTEDYSIFAFLAHLRGQIRTSLEMSSRLKQGGVQALQQGFPYLRGNLLEKKIGALRFFGEERLKFAFVAIVETELQARNSSLDPELLIDLLLIKLCHSSCSPTS